MHFDFPERNSLCNMSQTKTSCIPFFKDHFVGLVVHRIHIEKCCPNPLGHNKCSKGVKRQLYSMFVCLFCEVAVCYNHHLDKYHDLIKKGKWNGCSNQENNKRRSRRIIFITQFRERIVVNYLLICSFIIEE